ncbi:hypothetical protein [Mycolicibacterium fortuitum]|uniref:Uncharacterized protein n=2 Tax=Mycolicibacterium fortuitum TaxID=1766 RepID=A0AAE4VG40_MYCFO|nr:hypothetical protein [Mycolicibacterium fortuitum]MCV7143560.1 hypothetical protein [Mycolicibacterium fortuitum]MDV7193193.1 hypothetical protein [Mycolicibacterium fortuitum]MDV7206498.1 hypothetical protein [Mycolicibacterium fortuitum]MDV7228024.1 hypothetical protein [Mycolicibacterium fortuitum]MDV7260329.1 hypothetical protein [Mycolicibacterium fortuitum]
MAPSGEHRPEDLGYSAVHSAAVATSNGAIALRKQVAELHTLGAGKTVATRCETLTAQAVAAEKLAANLAATAKALKLREDAAKAWNKNAPKDSEIKTAEEAVTAAKKKLQDASAASGDTSAASRELEAAQKKLGELHRKRREADKAFAKAEEKASLELAKIAPEDTSADSGNGTGSTPAPATSSPRPSGDTGKRSDPGKSTAGTAKPSATPAGTPSPSSAKPAETNTATPESAAALAALLGQQQQPQPQAQQAQPAAATPAAATPQVPQQSQPTQDKAKSTGTSPLDRILGSDGVFGLDDAARALGPTAVALGGGSAPTTSTPSTPAAAVTPSAPASSTTAPSTTGLSAGTVTQPVTSGTSATGLNTNTDVSGRAGEARNAFSPTGPETKTSSATGTGTNAAPASATVTRPMGGAGMPMVPMGAMGGPGSGAGKDREQAQTTLASGSEESYYLHGRQAVDAAVPGGTIAQKDHPRRRPPESDAA